MRRGLVLAVAAVAAAAVAAAYAATRPDPAAQAEADGCVDDLAGMFKHEVPRWAYVNDKDFRATGPPPPPQWVKGVLSSGGRPAFFGVHPTPIDDPANHDSYDVILNVDPDPQYEFLLGAGNSAGQGEHRDRLHSELEQNAFPIALWPEQGDRVEMLGSWIWDCPHEEEGGQRTEFHPFRVLWVQRGVPSPRSPFGEAEGDLLITTDKTPAGKHSDCGHKAKGDRAAFKSCVEREEPNWQDVNGDYRFTLAAPPRPSPTAKLSVRLADVGSTPGAPRVTVTPGPRGVAVSVKVAEPPLERIVIAKQVFVGWRPMPVAALPQHLRVRFETLLVRRAMDPGCPPAQPRCPSVQTTRLGQISQPPGEWTLYSDVSGIWSQWALLRPSDGQTLRIARSVDFYVGRRRPWRLFVFARECDFGTLSASDPGTAMAPCPKSAEFGDLEGDDSPGSVVDRYRSPAASLGRHASNARHEGSSCPLANASGCYRLTYSVTRVADEAKRAAARP